MSSLPYRILVVEDETTVRDLIKDVCEPEKNHVFTAGCIAEARKILETRGADILILDRGLPDGDGLALCSELRNTKEHRALPILVLTGKAATDEKVLGLNLGADDYLAKPFALEELKARITSLMRRSEELSKSSYIKRRLWRY
jgi:DNA-binding response OmpR family regulator